MSKCRKCGKETWQSRLFCLSCSLAWQEKRKNAFVRAESELGKLCADNHKAIVKRIKEIEKENP